MRKANDCDNRPLRYAVVMLEKASKKNGPEIWRTASRLLAAPAAQKVEVNVGRISRVASADGGARIFVPGKVLGSGIVEKKVVVGAFSFSASARQKIESKGGSAMTAEEFLTKYPEGSGVTLVK
jgi:large subunit ribosomal protein L18e